MKKFLTVLLALSVVFTYSFGTVFAAQTQSDADKTAAVNADLKLATEVLNSSAASYQATEKTKGEYADDAIVYAVEATKNIGLLFINNYSAQLATEDNDYPAGNPVTADLNKWLTANTPTVASAGAYTFTGASWKAKYDSFVSDKDFEVKKAAALKTVADVNEALYFVDADATPAVDDAERAKELKKEATDALKAVTKTANVFTVATNGGIVTDSAVAYDAAINAILYGYSKDSSSNVVAALTSTSTATEWNAAAFKGLFGKLEALTTIAEKEAADAGNKETVSFGMSELSTFGKVTFYKAKRVTADADGATDITSAWEYDLSNSTLNGVKIAKPTAATNAEVAAANTALMARIDATLAVLNVYFAENPSKVADEITTESGDLMQSNFAPFEAAITAAELTVDNYDIVAATGAAYKLELDALTGTKKYDDTQIDKLVAKAQTALYANYNASQDTIMGAAFDDLTDISSALNKAIAEAKAKFTSTEKADAKYGKAYYDTDADVQAEVDVLLDKAKDDLDAARTVDEVSAIMAALDAKLATYRTAEQETAVDKAIADGNYVSALTSYAASQYALLGSDYRADSVTQNVDDTITSAYEAGIELLNSAKTAAELPGLYEQAKALFANIKSDAEIKAAAKTVADMIAALPTAATLAERDVLVAAKAAYDDFKDIYGAADADIYNLALLTTKLTTLKTAEINSIKDAVAALPAASKMTLADVAKVEAIRVDLEKYLTEYEIESYTYIGSDTNFNITTAVYDALVAAETKAAALEKDAAAKLIYDLPAEITLANADAVKAARAAFDALDKTQQAELINNGYYAKLVKAETALDKLDAVSLAGLNLKATTKKVGKKVRVYFKNVSDEVKALGDNAYIQVWKSKNAVKYNFSKRAKVTAASTLISKTYNGKNYVKYRVVVVNEDGTKTFSAWSTNGCRIIRK